MILTILIIIVIIIIFIPYPFDELNTFLILPFKNDFKKLDAVPYKKRNIKIITAENRNDEYIKLHDLSFSKYASKYNYKYIRTDNCPKQQSSTYWCKVHKVRELLYTNCDYVMWVDSDTIITDQNTSIDKFISEIGEPDIIFGEDGILYPRIVACAGVFLIKNSPVGKAFIDDCLNELHKRPTCIVNNHENGLWAGICYEQGIMNLLIKTKYSQNVYIDISCKFILNKTIYYNQELSKTHILHLPGTNNELRFKKFLSINSNA